MTRPHDDHAPAVETLDAERLDRIRSELAALGEEPADDDELALALGAGPDSGAAAHEGRGAADDVRTVSTLVALSTWVAPAAGLLPLERQRVWQRVAPHLMTPASTGRQAHGVVPPIGGLVVASTGRQAHGAVPPTGGLVVAIAGGAPAANDGAGFRGVLASLALVAGVALLLRVDVAPPPSAEDRAALASMGQATRAALELTVPGEQDGARARALADGYAERLHAPAQGADP